MQPSRTQVTFLAPMGSLLGSFLFSVISLCLLSLKWMNLKRGLWPVVLCVKHCYLKQQGTQAWGWVWSSWAVWRGTEGKTILVTPVKDTSKCTCLWCVCFPSLLLYFMLWCSSSKWAYLTLVLTSPLPSFKSEFFPCFEISVKVFVSPIPPTLSSSTQTSHGQIMW